MRCNASSAIGDFVASNTSNSLRLACAQQATWMTCGGWFRQHRVPLRQQGAECGDLGIGRVEGRGLHIAILCNAGRAAIADRLYGRLRSAVQAGIRRGVFKSVPDLQDAINRYIREHNKAARPFVWSKPADAILDKLARLPAPSV